MSCRTSPVIVNKKIIDTESEPMLIGRVTRDALTEPEFNDWYSREYDSYVPDPKIIKNLKGKVRLYTIEVFFGTWCSDTQEQLPRFLKILDEVKYPEKYLKLYAVNKNKESFYGEQGQKAITNIPTFIVYKTVRNERRGHREVGRIVETPKGTLESELYRIITGKKFNEETKKIKKKKNRPSGKKRTEDS
ncbi:MAG: thioredoxin family protein [Flavobacteriaceae bacterium]|nr:thioredoxin family protein [Flavobacteriaceae bacterium]